jgi:hypothetical protein
MQEKWILQELVYLMRHGASQNNKGRITIKGTFIFRLCNIIA